MNGLQDEKKAAILAVDVLYSSCDAAIILYKLIYELMLNVMWPFVSNHQLNCNEHSMVVIAGMSWSQSI